MRRNESIARAVLYLVSRLVILLHDLRRRITRLASVQ